MQSWLCLIAIARPDLLERICIMARLDQLLVDAISKQAEATTALLKGQGYHTFHCELSLQIHVKTNAQTNAIIDLLAEGDDGFMITDHNSTGSKEYC